MHFFATQLFRIKKTNTESIVVYIVYTKHTKVNIPWCIYCKYSAHLSVLKVFAGIYIIHYTVYILYV